MDLTTKSADLDLVQVNIRKANACLAVVRWHEAGLAQDKADQCRAQAAVLLLEAATILRRK